MNIKKNSIVTMHYCLALKKGQAIDSTFEREPMSFLMGNGSIIKGLDEVLIGRAVGDSFNVSIEAKNAYGIYNKELTQTVPKESFEDNEQIEVGMQFQTETETGVKVYTIIEIKDEQITIDENHPLAGQDLNFDIHIMDARLATEEETLSGRINQETEQQNHG